MMAWIIVFNFDINWCCSVQVIAFCFIYKLLVQDIGYETIQVCRSYIIFYILLIFFFLIKHCLITCITGLINVKLEGREALLQTHLYKGYLTLYSYDEWKKLIVYAYSITQRGEGLGAHHHKYEDQNKIIDN